MRLRRALFCLAIPASAWFGGGAALCDGASLGGAVLIQAAAGGAQFDALAAECSYSDFRSVAEDRLTQRLPAPRPAARAIARGLVSAGPSYARIRYGLNLDEASPVEASGSWRRACC